MLITYISNNASPHEQWPMVCSWCGAECRPRGHWGATLTSLALAPIPRPCWLSSQLWPHTSEVGWVWGGALFILCLVWSWTLCSVPQMPAGSGQSHGPGPHVPSDLRCTDPLEGSATASTHQVASFVEQ